MCHLLLDGKARFSAASTNSFTASARFGFLSAEMASLSSASTRAFFFAFGSWVGLELAPVAKRLVGLSFSDPLSPLGIIDTSGGSLPSLFSPGIVVALADRKRAIVLAGPREMLRLIRSLDRTCSSVFSLGLPVVCRFAGAPGRSLEGKPDLGPLSLTCG